MKERVKWLLAGVGIMYVTQLIVLLAIRYLMPHSGPEEFHNLMAAIGYTLVAFLVGGFVMGLMAERILIWEPALAAAVALLSDVISNQAGFLKDIFLFGLALEEGAYGTSLMILAVAVVAAIAGSLAGERITTPREDWISQVLLLVGLAGLFLGPFLVLGSYLPMVFQVIIGLALLGGILIAAYRFGRTERPMAEISIHPESHPPPDELHAR